MTGKNLLPSEVAVRAAIEGLKSSPGTFQRFCEIYAQLRYPDRFSRIVPYGRRADDVTIRGWPDAYAPVDGGAEALEFTHSPASARHLRDDRERLKVFEGKVVKGFLFIAWSKSPQFDILDEIGNELAELLEIPRSKITLVYAEELVRDLSTDGRFAKVLSSVLGLTTYPAPFWPVDIANHLYGEKNDTGLSAPSILEYRKGYVHRSEMKDTVEERLRDVKWVVVRGQGASGKTSLALQIAHGAEYIAEDDDAGVRHSKGYYLNLGSEEGGQGAVDVSAACKVITDFGDQGVLFILDNIHLNEGDAAQIFRHWKNASAGSRLLMLGREVKKAPAVKGTGGPLDAKEFRSNTIELKIEKTDLAGVYERLVKREIGYENEVRMPPSDYLEKWFKLFGGSLVIFSAAVLNKLGELISGTWDLTSEDADQAVRTLYLNPLETKPREKNDLLRIAAMAKWELDSPAETLENKDSPVKQAIDSGIVHRVTAGLKKYVRYHLIHPGLGELILRAADVSPVNETEILIDIVRRSPFAGLMLGSRLEAVGEIGKAEAVLKEVANDPKSLIAAILPYTLAFTAGNILRFERFGLLSKKKADEYFSIYKSDLLKAAMNSHLGHFAVFLKFAHKNEMNKTYDYVIETFGKEDDGDELIYRGWFIEKALLTPLSEFKVFFDWAESDYNRVFRIVKKALNEKNEQGELVFKEDIIRKFYEAAVEHFVTFLELANAHMPNVFDTLVGTLNSVEYRGRLAGKILKTRLDNLNGFFRYIGSEVKAVDLGPIIAAIEITEWVEARDFPVSDELDGIKVFADFVVGYGRPELVEAPARNIILKTRSLGQHSTRLGLHHISYTLKYGRSVGNEEIERFVSLITNDDWLTGQYKSLGVSPGSIAGFLYSVWSYNDEKILRGFQTNTLVSRVENELKGTHERRSVEIFSGRIQLLGIAVLLALSEPENIVKAPPQKCIDAAVDHPTPLGELDYLGFVQVQFWLGLRELGRLFPGRLSVPAQAGDKILELWSEALENLEAETEVDTKPEIARLKPLYADMIKWLKRCKAKGWQLVAAPRLSVPRN